MWATYGRIESGDDIQIVLWDHEPNRREVDAWYKDYYPDEYEECYGVEYANRFMENKL